MGVRVWYLVSRGSGFGFQDEVLLRGRLVHAPGVRVQVSGLVFLISKSAAHRDKSRDWNVSNQKCNLS